VDLVQFCGRNVAHGSTYRCDVSSVWVNMFFILTPSNGLILACFIYRVLC
jgi:hypothetical protein